jgi:multidrug efflux pump subunit AcrB
MKDKFKEFKPSSWAIENRTAIYVITAILTLFGFITYNNLPKEQFPEVELPQIIVQTIYPGTSPENMENLVSKPIEKEVKNLTGVKRVTSNSFQDFSVVIVEFTTDIKIEKAKQDVKDAVDKARPDLPNNLPNEPEVNDIDLSEMPIMAVNLSGPYDFARLKRYAEDVEDKIEEIKEIKRVDIVGALEREIQINVDLYRMQAAGFTFDDIERAVAAENISATAGEVSLNNQKRIISIRNEFKSADQIASVVVRNSRGATQYLRDIAEVKDTYEEQKSYARLDGQNVITLNVIKATGENLIEASDKIEALMKEMKAKTLPQDLKVVTTGDQSETTRVTLHDLINTIIIGFLLVTFILMFFMGLTNAVFVALSVPLSCALAFLFMPMLGFTLNMVVLFSFLLALGIVVDDAIVVIENTHRIFDNGKVPIKQAAKGATGEVFLPVLSGTLTTLMPFIPLAFWPGVIGSFMFFLPITLIITLLASLVVAYIVNPVFAVDFMKPHADHEEKPRFTKRDKVNAVIFGALALLGYISGHSGFSNFLIVLFGFMMLEKFYLRRVFERFQKHTWPRVQNWYSKWLQRALRRPAMTIIGTLALAILSGVLLYVREVDFEFFARQDPNFTYVYLNMPVGTDQAYTNDVLRRIEGKVEGAIRDPKTGKRDPIVKSVISNVTVNAIDPTSGEVGEFPNKGRVQVSYVEFGQRDGRSSAKMMERIRSAVKGVPGAQVTVDKEGAGPPLPKPIVIELTGDNLDTLVATSERLKNYLESKNISGVEELRSDFQADKPEVVFDLNRERMNAEGVSSFAVTSNLRTAVFGKEISRFRDAKDDYPITLRAAPSQRTNVEAIRNLPVGFMDMATGGFRQIPIASFANVRYSNTYGGIKRKDAERIITLSSNVLGGANAQETVDAIAREINGFRKPAGINIRMGGQQEDQAETGAFLGRAFLIAVSLIFLTLMLQFSSISRTLIIMSVIVLSLVGVLLGLGLFKPTFSMVFSGIGFLALIGIVVRNGILLVEFMDLMLKQGMSPYEAVVESGRTRMTPVILTASAAILGLIPLAVGLNMDFATLFAEGNPHIYFGGDNAALWGPLAWTMIYGLAFATVLTLIVLPVLMLLALRMKAWIRNRRNKGDGPEGGISAAHVHPLPRPVVETI